MSFFIMQRNDERESRVILAIGKESLDKLKKLKVGMIGLGTVGTEVAKNLLLLGVNLIDVIDTKNVSMNDVGCNFYSRQSDCEKGLKRVETIIPRLQEINQSCIISSTTQQVTNEWLINHEIIVVSEIIPYTQLIQISGFCHEHNIMLICALAIGAFSILFEDFKNFIVENFNGKQPIRSSVINVVKGETSTLYLSNPDSNQTFHVGMEVTFDHVLGMPEINGVVCKLLKQIPTRIDENLYKFKIDFDSRPYQNFVTNEKRGYCTEVKKRIPIDHVCFSDSITQPLKEQKNQALRNIFIALTKYVELKGNLIPLLSREEAESIINDINYKPLDKELVMKILMTCSVEYPSSAVFIGGCAAHEILKYATHIHKPIVSQWHITDLTFNYIWKNIPQLENSRYDPLISIFGNEIMEKIRQSGVLVLGAGAIGSEFIRFAAIFGFKYVDIFDNDLIEISNLSRQFLFRPKHIGKPKSDIAREAVLEANSDLDPQNIKSHVMLFNEETQNFVDSTHLKFVVSAVDSIKARLFIADFCKQLNISMINSGMEGAEADFSYTIPHYTDVFTFKGTDAVKTEKDCTLRNTPTAPIHIVQSVTEQFTKWFQIYPEDTSACINDIRSVKGNQLYNAERFIKSIPTSFRDCVQWAYKHFVSRVEHRVENLLYHHSPDTVEGREYWESRHSPIPHVTPFDPNNHFHMQYLIAASVIKANMHDLQYSDNDVENIINIIPTLEKPVNKVKMIKYNLSVEENDDKPPSELFINQLPEIKKTIPPYHAISYNKDNNYHVDLFEGLVGALCESYDFRILDRFSIIKMSSSIAPTLATTTSVIGSLATVALPFLFVDDPNQYEFYTIGNISILNEIDLCFFKSFCTKSKLGCTDKTFTKWDAIIIDDNPTLKELHERLESIMNLQIGSWLVGDYIVPTFEDSPDDHVVEAFKDQFPNCKFVELDLYSLVNPETGDDTYLTPTGRKRTIMTPIVRVMLN